MTRQGTERILRFVAVLSFAPGCSSCQRGHAQPRHKATVARDLLEYARGKAFIADAGYDSNDLIDAVREVDMKPVVRPNGSRIRHVLKLDRRLYKIRYRVEVFFHRLKRFRAIGTRYDKTAKNYLSLIHVACIALRLGWN